MRLLLKQPFVGSPQFMERVKAQGGGETGETGKTGIEEGVPVPRMRPAVRPILSVGLSLLFGVGLMASWGMFHASVRPEQGRRTNVAQDRLVGGRTAGASKGIVMENVSPVLTQAAPTLPSLNLNHTEWDVQLMPMAFKSANSIPDRLRFEQGQFDSTYLSSQGFPKSNCTVTLLPEGGLRWETMQTHSSGETVFWRGEWDGHQMRGILSRRPVGGAPQDYLFRGIAQEQDQKPSSTNETERTL